MPRNDFDFFRLFAEIFDYFGASPVSMTSAMHAMTPVSDTYTVLESFTGVNDTGKKLLTGVIDTGVACIRRCQWQRRLLVSMTLEKHVTGVVDTGDVMHHRCHWYWAVNITNFAGVSDTGEAPEKSNIRKKSKSLLGLSTWARRSCLKKKTRGEKSGGTVPLNLVHCI
jgi:hypothetical protein